MSTQRRDWGWQQIDFNIRTWSQSTSEFYHSQFVLPKTTAKTYIQCQMQSRRLCWFSALLVDAIESEDGNSSCWLLKALHTISNQQFLANKQKSHTFLYQIFRIFLYNLHNLQTISHRSICTIAFFFIFLCCSVKFHIERWFDFPRKNSDSKWRKAKLLSQTEEGSISLFLSARTILYSFPTTFFFIFFSTGILPIVFKSSTSIYPIYQPPVFLENQTWPMFEILKQWEILIRLVIKDFNSRFYCAPLQPSLKKS